jgi:hypothetical protein
MLTVVIMIIILGRPFLKMVDAVLDAGEGKVTIILMEEVHI